MMKALILGIAALPSVLAQASSEIRPGVDDPSLHDLRLIWSDEFNGASLDTSLWDYRMDSKHWSKQKPENVEVSNGTLKLHLKKEDADDKRYTGAGVISKATFRYGYYEARLKIPPGGGWHTSFWMMRHNRKGDTNPEAACQELDVIENDSIHQTSYEVNIHRWKDGHVPFGGKKVETPNLSADLHVFGCEFTPETVRYFFDGKLVRTFDITKAVDKEGKEWPFPHGDQNIWLTSIASHLGGTKSVDDSALPAMAEFDYVRFFARP